MSTPTAQHLLSAAAFILFIFGVLLAFELVRPFRDLRIDGPIAMGCWTLGALAAGGALWFRMGLFALNVAALALNGLALAAMGALLLVLSRSARLF